jgi:hypothetical protein
LDDNGWKLTSSSCFRDIASTRSLAESSTLNVLIVALARLTRDNKSYSNLVTIPWSLNLTAVAAATFPWSLNSIIATS